ncbi:MAG: sulfite exporter TauE/SafE family protein [Candidatus Micrarchaeota archaeon]
MLEIPALFTGLLAGIASGLFGIGGAAIAIPLLHGIFNLSAKESVGTAIFLAALSAASGAFAFRGKKLVDKKFAASAGLAGIIFSVAGAWLTIKASDSAIAYAVAGIILFFALVTFFGGAIRQHHWSRKVREHRFAAAAAGAFVGAINGFTGLGGGVPLTALLGSVYGLSAHAAAATSLATILIFSLPGAVAHLALGNTNTAMLLPLLAGGVIGSQIGVRLGLKVEEKRLRAATASFFLLLGAWMALAELLKAG